MTESFPGFSSFYFHKHTTGKYLRFDTLCITVYLRIWHKCARLDKTKVKLIRNDFPEKTVFACTYLLCKSGLVANPMVQHFSIKKLPQMGLSRYLKEEASDLGDSKVWLMT